MVGVLYPVRPWAEGRPGAEARLAGLECGCGRFVTPSLVKIVERLLLTVKLATAGRKYPWIRSRSATLSPAATPTARPPADRTMRHE